MLVTYRPKGGQEQTWEYDRDTVKASRAEQIEKLFGGSWEQFNRTLQAGGMKARRILLWYLTTLDHPGMPYKDTPDFAASELECQYSRAEILKLQDEVAKSSLSDEDREQALLGLSILFAEAEEPDPALQPEPEAGKALSPSDEPGTS